MTPPFQIKSRRVATIKPREQRKFFGCPHCSGCPHCAK